MLNQMTLENYQMTIEKRQDHLAIFISNLNIGGAERVAVTMANEFANKGTEVDLVVMNSIGPMAKSVSSKVKIVDLGTRRGRTSFFSLITYIKNSRPEAVLSLLIVPNALLGLSRLFLGPRRPRLIGSEHSYTTDVTIRGNRKTIPLFAYVLAARVGYRLLDGVVVPSQGIVFRLTQQRLVTRKKIVVIPNPIDLSEITLKPDSKSQTEASIKLIAVGRLDEIKDYPTMIRAVGLLRNTYKVSLDIIGDGNIKESLTNLINELNLAEHITLVGEVLELSHWYREADVLVLSSLSEGFGNVIVEALAHGTPVVSTDCPSGPSDIITENTYGRLVPVGDFVALADAIIQVRLQAIDKKILRARAEDFECSKICDAYKKVLIKKNCDY